MIRNVEMFRRSFPPCSKYFIRVEKKNIKEIVVFLSVMKASSVPLSFH